MLMLLSARPDEGLEMKGRRRPPQPGVGTDGGRDIVLKFGNRLWQK